MSIATQVESLWNGLSIAAGTPLEGGKVYSYEAGTMIAKDLYLAQDKSEKATNPLILDSLGRASVWGDGNYKFIIKDAENASVMTIDGLVYGKESVRNNWCGLSTGGPNDFIVGATPPIEELINGDVFSFIANDTNTSDGDPDVATLKINSLAALPIKTTTGADIAAGDIDAGAIITVIYNIASNCYILDMGSLTPAYSDVTISSLTANTMVGTDANKKLITKSIADVPVSSLTASLVVATDADKKLVTPTASSSRTLLGLGTISTQAANAVAITGGTISGLTTFTSANISDDGNVATISGQSAYKPGIEALDGSTSYKVLLDPGDTHGKAFRPESANNEQIDLGRSAMRWREVHAVKFIPKTVQDYTWPGSLDDTRVLTSTSDINTIRAVLKTLIKDLIAIGLFS